MTEYIFVYFDSMAAWEIFLQVAGSGYILHQYFAKFLQWMIVTFQKNLLKWNTPHGKSIYIRLEHGLSCFMVYHYYTICHSEKVFQSGNAHWTMFYHY